MKFKIYFLGFVFLFAGCAMNKAITYKTKDIQSIQNEELSKIILNIEEFADKRREYKINDFLFDNPRQTRFDGRQICINSERHYKKSPVINQVTEMFVEHLDKRNSFNTIVMNNKDTADYYISGNLTFLHGKQNLSGGAVMGAQFGLVGALATAGLKTAGVIIIEFTDLKIYNKNDEVVKDIGTYRKEYWDDFPADAYCWCIFDNVNIKLKEYFSELIEIIEENIIQIK